MKESWMYTTLAKTCVKCDFISEQVQTPLSLFWNLPGPKSLSRKNCVWIPTTRAQSKFGLGVSRGPGMTWHDTADFRDLRHLQNSVRFLMILSGSSWGSLAPDDLPLPASQRVALCPWGRHQVFKQWRCKWDQVGVFLSHLILMHISTI